MTKRRASTQHGKQKPGSKSGGAARKFGSALELRNKQRRGADLTASSSVADRRSKAGAQDCGDDKLRGRNTTAAFKSSVDYVIREADIVLEVLDARNPLQSRSTEFERRVVSAGKLLILLLNKIDLVPRQNAEAWQVYLQRESGFRCMPFKSARVSDSSRVPVHSSESRSHVSDAEMESAHLVVGAVELLSYVKHKSLNQQFHVTSIKVGVLGKPNVGKSSVIASLCRSSTAVQVGGQAGVTRCTKSVKLDNRVTLIDCPGVIPVGPEDSLDNVLSSATKVTAVKDPVLVVAQLLEKYSEEQVSAWYGVTPPLASAEHFLFQMAEKRGKLRAGGAPDLVAAAHAVIHDYTSGKIRHFTLPPALSIPTSGATATAELTGLRVVHERRAGITIPDL